MNLGLGSAESYPFRNLKRQFLRERLMKKLSGFTLIELLITLAIIGILTAVALPSYQQYVIRSRLSEAFSALATAQASAEQFWANNRTYVGFNAAAGFPANTTTFSYGLSNQTTSTYLITATGAGSVNGFTFTIDQNGAKATPAVPTGWTTSTTCWVNGAGGVCTQ